MIVRILGEGQFDVPDERIEALNVHDEKLAAALESDDPGTYSDALLQLLAGVREAGTRLPPDMLHPSDLVLPGPDSSLDEVRALLGDEGLIPD